MARAENDVVRYAVGDGEEVQVEIEPTAGFRPVSRSSVLGDVRDGARPAIKAAEAVLRQAREASPDEVVIRFGIKVSAEAGWVIARNAAEGHFEVTLRWKAEPIA